MKKLFFALAFLISVAVQAQTNLYYQVTSGTTVVVSPSFIPKAVYVYSGTVTLSNDYILAFSGTPMSGTEFTLYYDLTSLNRNGHSVVLFGQTLTDVELSMTGFISYVTVRDDNGDKTVVARRGPATINGGDQTISGDNLIDYTVPTGSLEKLNPGEIIIGAYPGANKVATISGDATMDSSGVLSISSGVITNTEIDTSAAIAWSKLASGTASYVVVTNGSGVLTTSQYVGAVNGGTGISTSSATGFPTVSSGTWSVGNLTDSKTFTVSFDSSSLGDYRSDNKIKMPFAGTITGIYAYATKVIAGTDNATIVPKNNGGTTMGSGTITFTAGDAKGTAYTSTPVSNNTFIAGDVLSFTTSKVTPGGQALVTITYTRSQ